MSDTFPPEFLKDAVALLEKDGFRTSDVWYHGTASGLAESIMTKGLIGGGDTETAEREQKTLGTIGNRQFAAADPVYLTQSRELALYWAIESTHRRNLLFQTSEFPLVLRVDMTGGDVKPDAGAAAIAIEPGNNYMEALKLTYEEAGIDFPEEINPLQIERDFYLKKLGMAYSADPVPADRLSVVRPD